MLTPIEMLAKKNRLPTRILMGLLLALFVAGCMPSGPRALLNGKKLLDAGDYAGAVDELRTATTLLPNSATAWNYLGVAYQKAQQPDNAATAYQRALTLDRDLVVAHWNLGMLYLEQNKNDQALSEFTAFTLRQPNTPDGWLKLGAAQLRLGQIVPAEASFSWVLRLDGKNAEAINGLGLARIERNRPRDAIQFFAAALQEHPGDPTALLNLAITEQTYLHDKPTALQYYEQYLALTPRPDNFDQVSAEAGSLEESITSPVAPSPPFTVETEAAPPRLAQRTEPPAAPPAPPPVTVLRRFVPPPPLISRPMLATKPQAMARNYLPPPQNHPAPAAPAPVVRSQSPRQPRPAQWVASVPPRTIAPANPPAVPPTTPEPAAKPGFWDRLKPTSWFAPSPADKKYENNGVTPLPTTGDSQAAADSAGPVAMDTFPRYSYQSPARPHAGDRPAAAGSFTSARVSEQASRFVDAMQQYHSAAEFDPSWFDAQYDYAVLCQRLGDYRQSLGAYEMALAIQPDSVDARYNFALALKAAGYVPDAVNELKRLLAAHPDEVRGHMALASLYAKKLHDTVRAREHYLKALDLDPGNPQAAGIRNWLSANPG